MKYRSLVISGILAVVCLSLITTGCNPTTSQEVGKKITKEAASAAGKALRQWQQQGMR
jgi:hypothetical protein